MWGLIIFGTVLLIFALTYDGGSSSTKTQPTVQKIVKTNAPQIIASPSLQIGQLNCRTGEYGWAEVIGQVVNNGNTEARYVKVYVDLKNGNNVVETQFTFVNGDDIKPHQSKTFDITFIDPEQWDKCVAYTAD